MEIKELGFILAKDIAIELITISTALLALSVTFAKETFRNLSKTKEVFLKIAWWLLLVSILLGIFSLMQMAGNLLPAERYISVGVTPVDWRVERTAQLQIITFVVGMFALGWLYSSESKFRTP